MSVVKDFQANGVEEKQAEVCALLTEDHAPRSKGWRVLGVGGVVLTVAIVVVLGIVFTGPAAADRVRVHNAAAITQLGDVHCATHPEDCAEGAASNAVHSEVHKAANALMENMENAAIETAHNEWNKAIGAAVNSLVEKKKHLEKKAALHPVQASKDVHKDVEKVDHVKDIAKNTKDTVDTVKKVTDCASHPEDCAEEAAHDEVNKAVGAAIVAFMEKKKHLEKEAALHPVQATKDAKDMNKDVKKVDTVKKGVDCATNPEDCAEDAADKEVNKEVKKVA